MLGSAPSAPGPPVPELSKDEKHAHPTINPVPVVTNVTRVAGPPLRTESLFFSALPMLVSLPLMLMASNLSLASSIATHYVVPARVAVLLLQVCLVLCAAKLLTKFKLAEPSSLRVSVDLAMGLFLFYLALLALASTRLSVLYFCLFANRWNIATPLLFVYDMHVAYQSSVADMGTIFAGYAALACSFWLVDGATGVKSSSLRPAPPFFVVFLASMVLLAVLFVAHAVDWPFLAITVSASSLVLFLASHNSVSSKMNILVIAVFSYCLECFVLATGLFSVVGAGVCIGLPCLTKIDRLRISSTAVTQESKEEHKTPQILAEILSHSDTKAIFHFLMLNTAFMFVQLLYSFRSKSLGLLSDSLHMALDCASLALGLVAGIWLKNPVNPNSKYPFGLKNFENLAGFANGTLLVGISGSIIFEAVGRLLNPVALQQTTELIVVSILGLLVNLVGIFAFNHGHSHSHGGGHSHGNSHSLEPCASEHSHTDTHGHSHEKSHTDSHSESQCQSHTEHGEETGEMNDNMRGIFLHILADTLGSVGVVISTVLTKIFHWQGFDPVASIIIAVLIFMTAIPLMKSTASTLLLRLDSHKEATVRNALNDLTKVKGIKSFTTPRFWASDKKLGGFIHIQVYRGENTAYLKRLCEEIFKSHAIDALIQMENDYDPCWCRT